MNPPSPARRRQATLSAICLHTGLTGREPFPAVRSPPQHGDAAAFGAWLAALAATPGPAPWTPACGAPWKVHATEHEGGLVLTLEGVPGMPGPLHVGIALHTRHGLPLWRVLTALPGARVAGRKPPTTPWYAWVGGEGQALDEAVHGFIRQCAHAWAARPGLRMHRRPPRGLDGAPAAAAAQARHAS